MSTNFIGRRRAVGIAVETTRGTLVVPAFWFRHLKLDFGRKVKRIDNNSAVNRMEAISDSAVVQEWGEGKVEGIVGDTGIGYLLANALGTVNTAAHAGETVVYDHTFTVAQSNTPGTHTFTVVDGNTDRRHAFGTLKSLEISAKVNDWVHVSGDIIADKGTDGTDTVAFTTDNDFNSKHITIKIATDSTGIAAATAIKASDFKIKIDRKADKYDGFNQLDPANYFVGAYTITGEFTLTYDDTTYEALYYSNAIKYLQVAISNTDINIGTSSHPSLTINAPRARVNTWTQSNDLDKVIEQTVGFSMELDVSTGKAIEAILTNLKTNYTS